MIPTSQERPSPGAEGQPYARFAKRDLDKMSWLAPLVNNPIGDLLNIELRHEQLFFVQADQVVDNVGYSEKGKRFSEAEYGKVIRNLDDMKLAGYWFVGRRYDWEVMREALRRQRDGYYYSIFSNQCQDWADRLERGAERVERELGIAPFGRAHRISIDSDPFVFPTEPASIGMGLVALAVGVGGFLAPAVAGGAFTRFLGVLLVASGLSHLVYALHGRDWRNLLPELLTSLIYLAAAEFMLWNREFARMAGSVVIAVTLAVHGAINVSLGLFNRPRSHWIGKLGAGFLMIAFAAAVASRWPQSGDRLLGEAVGMSLFAGGLSTILLQWKTRTGP